MLLDVAVCPTSHPVYDKRKYVLNGLYLIGLLRLRQGIMVELHVKTAPPLANIVRLDNSKNPAKRIRQN